MNNPICLTGTHFWVFIVLESMGQSSFADTLGRFPLLGLLYISFNPGWLKKLTEGSARHEKYTIDLVQKLVFCPLMLGKKNTLV